MTEDEQKEVQKARDMLDAQPVPELSPESLYNIMEAMGFAQRTWVGLTYEERVEIQQMKWWDWKDAFDVDRFMRAIEAKLKEKNT
jgi:hypothetical protein